MKIFNRTNLPLNIKYNNNTYKFNAKASGIYSVSKQTPLNKFVFVDVLSRNLRNRTNLHGQPYNPSRFIFTEKLTP